MANKAAWIKEKQAHPFEVGSAPMPDPGKDLVTIRVHAAAINPADAIIQAAGVLVDKYPAILGCDAAGEVTAIGSDVTDFKVGDRVAGCCDHTGELMGQGSFQMYCNLRQGLIAKIPDNVKYKDACVLPIGMSTACFGLFEKSALALPFPRAEAVSNAKVVLIWGGASSVGSCAIQAAKAAGCEVAATAGPNNLEYCKAIGADYVFDYKSETVVEDIVRALKGREFAGVFNSVMPPDSFTNSAEITHRLGGKQMVATVIPKDMPWMRELPHGVEFADGKILLDSQ
jgi:NADPH:quinone reductase-like Zn-dependent oxidoreductase